MTIELGAEPGDQLRADVAWLGAFQDMPGVLEAFVARHAPRVFALVEQDVGLLEDAVFGWGFQFADYALVIEGGCRRRSRDCPSRASSLRRHPGELLHAPCVATGSAGPVVSGP